jgi:hypothetical protein
MVTPTIAENIRVRKIPARPEVAYIPENRVMKAKLQYSTPAISIWTEYSGLAEKTVRKKAERPTKAVPRDLFQFFDAPWIPWRKSLFQAFGLTVIFIVMASNSYWF